MSWSRPRSKRDCTGAFVETEPSPEGFATERLLDFVSGLGAASGLAAAIVPAPDWTTPSARLVAVRKARTTSLRR
ncbi:MAG: hypothetical protein U0527_11185 [Candidatus Eisenbacteria bacterium]